MLTGLQEPPKKEVLRFPQQQTATDLQLSFSPLKPVFSGGFPLQSILQNGQNTSLGSTTTLACTYCIKANLLEEVELGCLVGPFESHLFTIFKAIPLRLSRKNRLKRFKGSKLSLLLRRSSTLETPSTCTMFFSSQIL